MKQSMKFATWVFAFLMISSAAFAGSPWAGEGSYADQVKGKLDFGLKNVLGGWTELLDEPMNAPRTADGIAKGIGKGIYNAVVYTLGGVLHTVTFPVIQIDIPIPDNGVSF